MQDEAYGCLLTLVALHWQFHNSFLQKLHLHDGVLAPHFSQ